MKTIFFNLLICFIVTTGCSLSQNQSISKEKLLSQINLTKKDIVENHLNIITAKSINQLLSEVEIEKILIDRSLNPEKEFGNIDSFLYAMFYNKVTFQKQRSLEKEEGFRKTILNKIENKFFNNQDNAITANRIKIYDALKLDRNELIQHQKLIRINLDSLIEVDDLPKITLLKTANKNFLDYTLQTQLKELSDTTNTSQTRQVFKNCVANWRIQYGSINAGINPWLEYHSALTSIAEELCTKYHNEILAIYDQLKPIHKKFEEKKLLTTKRISGSNYVAYKNDFKNSITFEKCVAILLMNSGN